MAIMRWGIDDEEQKRREDPFSLPSTNNSIQSVQSAWQPTQTFTDRQTSQQDSENYLMSEEKAQADAAARQRREAEEAARAQAAAEAAARAQAARQAAAAQAMQASQAARSQAQAPSIKSAKNDDGWKRYYDEAFKQERSRQNFVERLFDNGSASRRAEIAARSRYANDMLNKAYDNRGNVLDANMASRARAFTDHTSGVARQNALQSQAITRAIGASYDNRDRNVLDRMKSSANAMRHMSLYDSVFGVNDTTRGNADDVGRFLGNLVQGVGTMPVIGAKELAEMGIGRGTDAETGFERNLSAVERAGRGVSGALNTAMPFMTGGGVKFLDDLFGAVAKGTATQTQKALLTQTLRKAASGAVTQGALGGAQASGEWVGNGGSFLNEKGELDEDKIRDYVAQVGPATALSAAGGAVFAGGGNALRHARSRRGANVPTRETSLTPARDVADGVPQLVTPEVVAQDGNVSFEPARPQPTRPQYTPAPDRLSPEPRTRPDGSVVHPNGDVFDAEGNLIGRQGDTLEEAPVADGIANAPEPTPVDSPIEGVELKPAQQPRVDVPSEVTPAADGAVQMPVIPARDVDSPITRSEQVRELQDARAGSSQAQEAEINQRLREVERSTPRVEAETPRLEDEIFARENAEGLMMAKDGKSNLPDSMTPVTPGAKPKAMPTLTPERQARQDVADVIFRSTSATQGLKGQLARALDSAKDTESTVSVLLKDAGVSGKRAENITSLFKRADEIGVKNAKIQKAASKEFVDKGLSGIDQDAAKVRNARTREEQEIAAELLSEIERLGVKGKKRDRLVKAFENVTQGRSANMLLGAPLERNWIADMIGTAREGIKNPAQIARGATKHGNIIGNTLESQTRDLRRMPKSFTEGYKQLTGGTFQALMTPAQVAANVRVNAARTQLAARIYKAKTGENLSLADAEVLSRNIGNDINALANMAAGVDNGTVNDLSYRKALKQFDKFLESGNEADWTQYLDIISKQGSLAESIMRGIENKQVGKTVSTTVNFLLPFMRNATNMTTKAFTRDMNPFSLSILDELRSTQMSGLQKLGAWAVNNGVNFGILYGLSSLLTYNDGSEVDKPRGVSIDLNSDGKLPDGVPRYLSVRATPIELPLALTLMVRSIAEDTMNGEAKKPGYYYGMIGNSIPYVDQMQQNSGVVGSVVDALNQNEEGDGGYAAKAFGVNMATSLTPFANNNLQAWMDRNAGKSTDAKSTYDKDPFKWYWNKLQDRGLGIIGDRDSLKGSYDAAGRQRTVDNQGAFINKTINNERTATYNDTIDNLVDYGRQAGFGKDTQEMFNSFDNGKNNHFNSVQSAIWAITGRGGNDTKLEPDERLAGLARQIRDGFFGDGDSDELLMVGGQNLYSDVGMPNARGSRNASKPLSMRAITQAIAAADLPKDQQDRINELGMEASSLYNRAKSGEITWDQRAQISAEIAAEERQILVNSAGFQKLGNLMATLDEQGFFEDGGLGSTRSGQTYLWNALNKLIGSKGKTPAADYPETNKGWTPWGRRGSRGGGGSGGRGTRAVMQPGAQGTHGIKWTPVQRRQMAKVQRGTYTPYKAKVTLRNAIKKDKSQNYSDRTF